MNLPSLCLSFVWFWRKRRSVKKKKKEEDEYLNIAHRSAKFDLLLFNA